MRLYQQLLQKARNRFADKTANAIVYEQEFVSFQDLLIAEGCKETDFSEKAWNLLEQVIQYPFDEYAYFPKELPENPMQLVEDEELFRAFLECLAEVMGDEGLSYDEINALPLGFRIAYYLLPWDESGGFMVWLGLQNHEIAFVREVAQMYYLIGLKKEQKAILKALRYADPDDKHYDHDMSKALIAYTYTLGHAENNTEGRLTAIYRYFKNSKKPAQFFTIP